MQKSLLSRNDACAKTKRAPRAFAEAKKFLGGEQDTQVRGFDDQRGCFAVPVQPVWEMSMITPSGAPYFTSALI